MRDLLNKIWLGSAPNEMNCSVLLQAAGEQPISRQLRATAADFGKTYARGVPAAAR